MSSLIFYSILILSSSLLIQSLASTKLINNNDHGTKSLTTKFNNKLLSSNLRMNHVADDDVGDDGEQKQQFNYYSKNSNSFRDSLRMKMKLLIDNNFTTSTSSSTTMSPLNQLENESLPLTSAELGTSKEINVEDQMRKLLNENDLLLQSMHQQQQQRRKQKLIMDHQQHSNQPLEPNHLNFVDNKNFIKNIDNHHLNNKKHLKAAIQTKHTIEYRPIKLEQLITNDNIEPKIIEVEARSLPLEIHFKSTSSRIKMIQKHEKQNEEQNQQLQQQTNIEEEPQRLYHIVRKPIIQEVREIIQPYRRIVQEIQPVLEQIHTVVSQKPEDDQKFKHDVHVGDAGDLDDNLDDTTIISKQPINVDTERESNLDHHHHSMNQMSNNFISNNDNFQRQMMSMKLKQDDHLDGQINYLTTTTEKPSSSSSSSPSSISSIENFIRSSQKPSMKLIQQQHSIYDNMYHPQQQQQQQQFDFDSSPLDFNNGNELDIHPAKQIQQQQHQYVQQQQQQIQRRQSSFHNNNRNHFMSASSSNQNFHYSLNPMTSTQWRPIFNQQNWLNQHHQQQNRNSWNNNNNQQNYYQYPYNNNNNNYWNNNNNNNRYF